MKTITALAELLHRRTKVLAYHGVEPAPQSEYDVGVEEFAAQLAYLAANGFVVLPLEQFVAGLADGGLPERSVAITFDDGLASVRRHALPLLEQFGFAATVFLPTAWIDARSAGNDGLPPHIARLMTWSEIADAAGRGLAFGGHSASHRSLRILGARELSAETAGCRDTLRARIGGGFMPFAYPYGAFDPTTMAAVEDAGFACAFSFGDVLGNSRLTPRFALRRESVLRTTALSGFAAKLDPGNDLRRKLGTLLARRGRRAARPTKEARVE